MKLIELNTARNCLRYLIKLYKIKELQMPYYICPVMWQAARSENCKVKFYHIDSNFYPTCKFDKNAFILYPNYFGINFSNVEKLTSDYKNVIVDNAHSYFNKKQGLASFNSLRKFFNVQEGAYLYCDNELTYELEEGNFDIDFDTNNENTFIQNEIRLNYQPIKKLNKNISKIISLVNEEKEKHIRLEQFNLYSDKYANQNRLKLHITKNDIPYGYPYLSESETLPRELKGKRILRYWTPLPKTFQEAKFYSNLIVIPLL